jgi:hypothetical protein
MGNEGKRNNPNASGRIDVWGNLSIMHDSVMEGSLHA